MKKRIAFLAALMGLAMNFNAQVTAPTWTEWHDMEVNNVNRLPVHTTFFAFENDELALQGDMTKSNRFLSLHGNWKFNWVENADQRPTDFFKTDLDDSAWGTMPVPGIWELNGYGDAEYVNSGFAWRGHFDQKPPQVPVKDNHVGSLGVDAVDSPLQYLLSTADIVAYVGIREERCPISVEGLGQVG